MTVYARGSSRFENDGADNCYLSQLGFCATISDLHSIPGVGKILLNKTISFRKPEQFFSPFESDT
jgi:hypothetical protein